MCSLVVAGLLCVFVPKLCGGATEVLVVRGVAKVAHSRYVIVGRRHIDSVVLLGWLFVGRLRGSCSVGEGGNVAEGSRLECIFLPGSSCCGPSALHVNCQLRTALHLDIYLPPDLLTLTLPTFIVSAHDLEQRSFHSFDSD